MNGKELGPVDLIAALNAIGGRHGVGRIDLVEDRMVGMKSRGVYETPGGTLLYSAHSELEQLVLDRRTLAAKDLIAPRYADIVYEGRWWTTEREAYDAFVECHAAAHHRVRCTSAVQGHPLTVIGRQSEHALYDERFVTFGEDDVYEQSDAAGFIRLYGLSMRVRAIKDQETGRRSIAVAGRGSVGAGARGRVSDWHGRRTPVATGACSDSDVAARAASPLVRLDEPQALGRPVQRAALPRRSKRSTARSAPTFACGRSTSGCPKRGPSRSGTPAS